MKPILSKDVQSQLADTFSELTNSVGILLFTTANVNCEYCELTEQLLDEVTAFSEKLTLKKIDFDSQSEMAKIFGVEFTPTIVVVEKDGDQLRDHGIRFMGIPGGHEFSSLIHSIIMVSKRESGLSEEAKTYLKSLQENLLLQVFVTPSCPYCPQSVILAHQMALESPNIHAEMVEAMEFAELSDRYQVSGVPHTIINHGQGSIVGAAPEGMLLQKIKDVVQS
jgi:glutaredoxin-like protein